MEKVFHLLKLYSIYTATAILLLHTFVPHSHDLETADDFGISCEKNDRCVMDFLGSLLEHDFGVDHLEHFKVQDQNNTNLNTIGDIKRDEIKTICLYSECKEWIISVQKYQNQSIGPDHHRGPPSYS